jgi:uncharacterized protein (DUF4415 family)
MKPEYDFSKARKIGPVIPPSPGKTRVTIRIDNEILDWFRDKADVAGGGNYQTMINEALHKYIEQYEGLLESTIRRVIREELRDSRSE